MRGAQAAETARFDWSRLVSKTGGSGGFARTGVGLRRIAATKGVIPERMGAGGKHRLGSIRNPRFGNVRRPGAAAKA